MNKNLTELVLVVDRSGSMSRIKNDAESGINSLIQKQKLEPGDCNITLCQFDNQYEIIYENKSLKTIIPEYKLIPRGFTALLDSIGQTINIIGERLSKTKEEDRPNLVYFVVVTDGEENSSRRFTKQKIKEMIKHQTNKYSWKFDFLGAGDSFLQGKELGFESCETYTIGNTIGVYNSIGTKMSRMRSQSLSGVNIVNSYTEEEKRSMQ